MRLSSHAFAEPESAHMAVCVAVEILPRCRCPQPQMANPRRYASRGPGPGFVVLDGQSAAGAKEVTSVEVV